MEVMRAICLLACGCMAVGALTSCAAHKDLNNIGMAASQPGPQSAAAASPIAAEPYSLTAQCSGPMVKFRLENLGDSELKIQNKDFALVVPGSDKQVIPYSNESVSVDLPTSVVAPHQTLEGRAVFKDNTMPAGCRLVFKPYSRPTDPGTYANINGPGTNS